MKRLSMIERLEEIDVGRRRALAAASACAATLLVRGASGQAASCAATQDSGEGPFYLDPSLVRSDVTSGRIGAPLDIAVQVTRARDCSPLAGARFDLWQADMQADLPTRASSHREKITAFPGRDRRA